MLRRLVLTANLDSHTEMLVRLRTFVHDRKPEGVLFAGGILACDPGSHAAKLQTWELFFAAMGKLGVFTAVIPGVADVPLRHFLRLAKSADVDHPGLHIAHATLLEEGDVALNGLGGDLSEDEDETGERLCYSRPLAEYFLRILWQADQSYKVLLLSVPPREEAAEEPGNRICSELIDSYHPSLCVVAGATRRRGIHRIVHSLVVNPGRLADGSVAWLDRNQPADHGVEFFKI